MIIEYTQSATNEVYGKDWVAYRYKKTKEKNMIDHIWYNVITSDMTYAQIRKWIAANNKIDRSKGLNSTAQIIDDYIHKTIEVIDQGIMPRIYIKKI